MADQPPIDATPAAPPARPWYQKKRYLIPLALLLLLVWIAATGDPETTETAAQGDQSAEPDPLSSDPAERRSALAETISDLDGDAAEPEPEPEVSAFEEWAAGVDVASIDSCDRLINLGGTAVNRAADDGSDGDALADFEQELIDRMEQICAEPEPDGEVEGVCDYLLDFDSGHTFAASMTARNTGNVGIVARLWVEYDMIGQQPERFTKRVRLRPGREREVFINEPMSDAQVDRHQSAGAECDLGIDLIDTFGQPQA